MTPRDCVKFDKCNASICPLDAAWRKAVQLPGEKVCPYLLGSGKVGAAEHYGDYPLFRRALIQLPLVTEKHPSIARAVAAASRTGFKSANLGR